MNIFRPFQKNTLKPILIFLIRGKSSVSTGNLNNLLLSMPKEKPHTLLLKAQRTKMKEKGRKYAPGTVTLQVLGSGAKGAPKSLYLFTDQSRYLFNCGEGTQRLAHEHKMKLSKLEHIFVTHASWDNLGGLPGVALTIQDVGVPEITLHGPEGIDDIFTATRRFVVLRDLSIHMADCTLGNHFEDNALTVEYAPLRRDSSKTNSEEITRNVAEEDEDDDTDYYAYERKSNGPPSKKRRMQNPDKGSEQSGDSVRKRERSEVVMSYICRLRERPGSLSIEKCAQLGVPPGPLLGKLKQGEDVVLTDGTVVRSADVTSLPDPAPVFIVVDCPSEEYLNSLEKEENLKRHQSFATKENDVAFLVAHFTPPHIMQHPTYKNWMEGFSPSTHHLILNESNSCLGSVAVHRIQYKLNLLEPSVFPLLTGDGMTGAPKAKSFTNGRKAEEGSENEKSELRKNDLSFLSNQFSVLPGHTFSSVPLRPKHFVNSSPRLKIDPAEYIGEVEGVEDWGDQLSKLKARLAEIQNQGEEYPLMTFLGTGSCIPNKTRNTSAILIDISKDKCLLFDCGEGSWGQIVRLGVSEEVLGRLAGVFISHLHADHHMGLIGLLRARLRHSNIEGSPFYLLAPKQIMIWLKLYHNRFEPILQDVHLVPNSDMIYNDYQLSNEVKENVVDALGVKNVETARVKHCPNSFAIAISHHKGWKITYSGDTMPCPSLVELGRDSDVLIHEATMEDELLEEAELKMHSTVSQAVGAGQEMKAKFILLTHFSQRYAKLPRLPDMTFDQLGIAFDNMRVRMCDLPKLPLFYPALKLMFQEECEELEQKALKRQYKLQRQKLTATPPLS